MSYLPGRKSRWKLPECACGRARKFPWTVTRGCNTSRGLTSPSYRRAVQSVLDGYGIEMSSVSREFVAASAAQLKQLCEKKLGDLDLVTLLIDGIHLGKQVLVVALGIETSGEKHVLGLWQGAPRTPPSSKSCWKTWWLAA